MKHYVALGMTWEEAYLHIELVSGTETAEQAIRLALEAEVFRKLADAEDEPVFREDFQRIYESKRDQVKTLLQ